MRHRKLPLLALWMVLCGGWILYETATATHPLIQQCRLMFILGGLLCWLHAWMEWRRG